MLTERQDIDSAYRIAGTSGPTGPAAIDPAMFAPLPAYGTRLRGKRLIESDGPNRLIVQLANNPARTGRADLLRLDAPDTLRRLIERLTDIAGALGNASATWRVALWHKSRIHRAVLPSMAYLRRCSRLWRRDPRSLCESACWKRASCLLRY